MDMKFYRCEHCGNLVTFLRDSGVNVVCCGEDMKNLTANTTDAAQEKHVPVMTNEDGHVTVKVGSAPHPMLAEHYIEWIVLQTKKGHQVKYLKPGEEPEACFTVCCGDEVEAVYEYCNLHGLWKA